MKNSQLIQYLTLLVFLLLVQSSATGRDLSRSENRAFIKKRCSVTAYPNLCYKSLARHSTRINSDPKALAATALNATLYSARVTSRLVKEMAKKRGLRRNEAAAMVDCVADIEDSVVKVGKYAGDQSEDLRTEMNDVRMWVNSALEDDETCVEALAVKGKVRKSLRRRIVTLARLTANALALAKQPYHSV